MMTSRPLQVLVVDDHADSARLVTKLLRTAGYAVSQAISAQEAREIAAISQFDVLVSDLGLPGESGLDLMRDLKARYGMKGIAVTGFDGPVEQAQSLDAGFAVHLVKPIAFDQLFEALKKLALPNP